MQNKLFVFLKLYVLYDNIN